MRHVGSFLMLMMAVTGCPGGDDDDCADAGTCESGGNRPGVFSPSGGSGGSGSAGSGGSGLAGRRGIVSIPGAFGGSGGAGSGGSGSGGSGSGDAGSADDYLAAQADALEALCECADEDLDTCTGISADTRACEADAVRDNAGSAGAWLACVTEYLQSQTACLTAAQCDDSALECDLISNENPIGSACGAAPSALAQAAGACAPDGPGTPTCEIPDEWICDGEADCPDASDEVGCPAGTTFTCDSGEQIPGNWECDTDADCQDGSDEANCGS